MRRLCFVLSSNIFEKILEIKIKVTTYANKSLQQILSNVFIQQHLLGSITLPDQFHKFFTVHENVKNIWQHLVCFCLRYWQTDDFRKVQLYSQFVFLNIFWKKDLADFQIPQRKQKSFRRFFKMNSTLFGQFRFEIISLLSSFFYLNQKSGFLFKFLQYFLSHPFGSTLIHSKQNSVTVDGQYSY